MNEFCETIRTVVAEGGTGPLLVHADAFRSRAAVMPITDVRTMLPRHMAALEFIAGPRALLLPTFNYDFLRTGTYRPADDVSQVGPLTEHARRQWATWRLGAPVFNVVGRGDRPEGVREHADVDPFGHDSVFAALHRAGGDVLLYGTTLATMTAIHYVERLSGGPLYRYDKRFPGQIHTDAGEHDVSLLYHCRPMGTNLGYDFLRLATEAEAAGALRVVRGPGSEVSVVRFATLCAYWLERLRDDPLYLLDTATRTWVAPQLERLGRRFELADFE